MRKRVGGGAQNKEAVGKTSKKEKASSAHKARRQDERKQLLFRIEKLQKFKKKIEDERSANNDLI